MDSDSKPFHTLILDAGPLIKNDPPISTLLSKSHTLLTLPAILSEIRDPATRSRVDTTLKPFLELRDPKPESLKVVQEFARRTGDLSVLSRVDLGVLALAYEVELERNGGDWRLRRVPGQKGLNGSPPGKKVDVEEVKDEGVNAAAPQGSEEVVGEEDIAAQPDEPVNQEDPVASESHEVQALNVKDAKETLTATLARTQISEETPRHTEQPSSTQPPPSTTTEPTDPDLASDSDSEGWITPSNLKKYQDADSAPPSTTTKAPTPTTLQVATLTSDFAMQNVLLLMNLNLISPSLTRVSHLRTYILRCHACFLQVKDLTKQFCPRCGQPALTRVSCSTDTRTGAFTLHLKKNMQWNTRGDRYSIPKPTHGSSNGKRNVGGGKGGWGTDLVLSEDQKEYVKKMEEGKRGKARDLMDEDYLPGILTGERMRGGGRVKVGAGRDVNSRKRR